MEKFFENVYEGNFFQFYFYSDSKIRLGMIKKYLSFWVSWLLTSFLEEIDGFKKIPYRSLNPWICIELI